MKRVMTTVMLALTTVMMMACSQDGGQSGNKSYNIGVIQFVQHPALDAANKGFFDALDEAGIAYEADQQNAGGEQSSAQIIADKLAADNNDVILAIATPSAQAMAGVTDEVPILVTAVTDPAESGLVKSNDVPGGNVTGTSDLTPVKEQIELLKKLIPDAKKIGIMYSSAEANSVIQLELAKEAAKENELELIEYTVSSSNEIQPVVESMIGKIDALYVPTDNMVASGMETVTMIANEHKIPVIGAESAHVDSGAVASYGIDYYELGKLTGKQAIKILVDGSNPADMPIEYLSESQFEVIVNEEVAQLLGIDTSVLDE